MNKLKSDSKRQLDFSSAIQIDMKDYNKRITNFKEFYKLFLQFEKDNNYVEKSTQQQVKIYYQKYKEYLLFSLSVKSRSQLTIRAYQLFQNYLTK